MSDGDGSDNATLLTIEQVGLCLATPDLEAPSSTQDHSSVVGHDFIGTDGINIVLKAASVPPNTSALLNPAPGVLPRAAGLAPGENLDVHDDMESEEEEGTGWDELGDTSAPSSQAAILLTPAYLPSAVDDGVPTLLNHPELDLVWQSLVGRVDECQESLFLSEIGKHLSLVCGLPAAEVESLWSEDNIASFARAINRNRYHKVSSLSINRLLGSGSFVSEVKGLIQHGKSPEFASPLPPDPFIGYKDELSVVLSALASGAGLLTVQGTPGCGLSSFLREVALTARGYSRFTGGIFLSDIQTALDEEEATLALARLLDVRVYDLPTEALVGWADCLTEPTLLLVDAGAAPVSAWKSFIQPLVDASDHLTVVLGCCKPADPPLVTLARLSDGEVKQLISCLSPSSSALLPTILSQSFGLPSLVTAWCRRLDSADPVAAEAILPHLHVFPATFDATAAAAVCNVARNAIEPLLLTLTKLGLLKSSQAGRWYKPPATATPASPESVTRFIAHFVHLLNTAEVLYATVGKLSAFHVVDVDRGNVSALLRIVTSSSPPSATVKSALLSLSADEVLNHRFSAEELLPFGLGMFAIATELSGPDSLHVSNWMAFVATLLESLCQVEEAMNMYTDTLDVRTAALGPQHPQVATVLTCIGRLHHAQGQINAALARHNQALSIRRALYASSHPDVASSLCLIAAILQSQDKLSEAFEAYREALDIQRSVLPAQHPDIGVTLVGLGSVQRALGQLSPALESFTEALVILQREFGEADECVIGPLTDIARLCEALGRPVEAIPYLRQAVNVCKSWFGPGDDRTAKSLHSLAVSLQGQGYYGEALSAHREAMEIRCALYGEENLDIAASLSSCAPLLQKLGHTDEAVGMLSKALSIRRSLLSPSHADVADTLIDLGTLQSAVGNTNAALVSLRLALTLRQSLLGPNHPDVASVMTNIAVELQRAGQLADALTTHQQCLEVRRACTVPVGTDIARSLIHIADILDTMGNTAEAIAALEEALSLQRQAWGAMHPDVAETMSSIASLLRDGGKYDESLALHSQCLVIRRELFGTQHTDVAATLNNIANTLADREQWEEALAMYREAMGIQDAVCGARSVDRAVTLGNIARALCSLGRLSEAMEAHREVLDVRTEVLGSRHESVGEALNGFASVLLDQGMLEESLIMFREALDIKCAALGPNTVPVADIRFNIGLALKAQGALQEAVETFTLAADVYSDCLGSEHPSAVEARHAASLCLHEL